MNIEFVTAVNNDIVLSNNLLASSTILNGDTVLHQIINAKSASCAYNEVLQNSKADILVFAHQDVYIPSSFIGHLIQAIEVIESNDPHWAVIGCIGVNESNKIAGKVWPTGIGKEVGVKIIKPQRVISLDELLLVVKMRSGIKFDINLPGFHLYGTDIVQNARLKSLSSYAIYAPVIHNSLPYLKFGQDFVLAYRYMQEKWKSILPIITLVTTITPYGWPLRKRLIKQYFNRCDRRDYSRLDNPAAKAKELGYE